MQNLETRFRVCISHVWVSPDRTTFFGRHWRSHVLKELKCYWCIFGKNGCSHWEENTRDMIQGVALMSWSRHKEEPTTIRRFVLTLWLLSLSQEKTQRIFFALFCCCCLFVSFFVCCFILFCFKKEGKVSVFDERQAWAIFEVWGNGTVVWGYKMQKVLRTNRPGEKSLASQK